MHSTCKGCSCNTWRYNSKYKYLRCADGCNKGGPLTRSVGLSQVDFDCCGTSEASEQQHNQDLREKYIGYEKSRFDRFLPEFTAPRTHLEPEFTAPRTIASLSFKPRFHFILRK